jgi:hypothetical protein
MDHREEYISNFHDVAVGQFASRTIVRQIAGEVVGEAISAGRQQVSTFIPRSDARQAQ